MRGGAGEAVRRAGWRGWLAGLALALVASIAAAQEIGTAARVNGVEIGIFRLERYFEDYLKEQGRNLGAIRSPNTYKRLKREALERLIDRELLIQEGNRRGVEVAETEVAAALGRAAAGYKTAEAFQRRLREAGFDEARFAAYLRDDLRARHTLAELVGRPEPEDGELRRIHRENRQMFMLPERVRARHILLGVPGEAGADEREAVRQRLLSITEEIRNGADFAQMAERHSEDSTQKSGGDLGVFPRGKMVAPFEAVAFSLPVGVLSEPVETRFGWHLIRVDERLGAEEIPEDQALALIRGRRAGEMRAAGEAQALQKLRQAARIEVLLAL